MWTTILGLFLASQIFLEGFTHESPSLPPLEITAADIVAVIAEYDVIQETNPVFCRQFYGMTDFDSHTISICALNDTTRRQQTLLHEIVHVMYWKHAVYSGGPFEPAVDAKAQELFKKFYGIPEKVQYAVPEKAPEPQAQIPVPPV